MIRRIVLLVAFALLVPCLAVANTVSFSTTGTFSNPSLFPITFTGNSVARKSELLQIVSYGFRLPPWTFAGPWYKMPSVSPMTTISGGAL
jgi:hypothetical protein